MKSLVFVSSDIWLMTSTPSEAPKLHLFTSNLQLHNQPADLQERASYRAVLTECVCVCTLALSKLEKELVLVSEWELKQKLKSVTEEELQTRTLESGGGLFLGYENKCKRSKSLYKAGVFECVYFLQQVVCLGAVLRHAVSSRCS